MSFNSPDVNPETSSCVVIKRGGVMEIFSNDNFRESIFSGYL